MFIIIYGFGIFLKMSFRFFENYVFIWVYLCRCYVFMVFLEIISGFFEGRGYEFLV